MTQLVELQRALPRFREAGIKLYAVSYDAVAGLAAFARAHDIGFPLLSDADSSVIRRYGILNTLIDPGEALFYGIPFPGSYVVDEAGVVVEKFFSRHVATRESPETLLDGALGRILLHPDEPTVQGGDEAVRVVAAFHGGGGAFTGGNRRQVVVRFALRNGLHLYAPPVPEGMRALEVRVEGPPGLVAEEPELPPSEPFESLGRQLQVYGGGFDVVVPVYADSRLVPMLEANPRSRAELSVTVSYQACDDRTCLVPRTERFALEVGLEAFTVPRIGAFAGTGQRFAALDSGRHVLRLARRGALRRPLAGARQLLRLLARRIRS